MKNTIDTFYNDDMNADLRDAKKSERPLIIRAYQIATELDKLPRYAEDKKTYNKISNISSSYCSSFVPFGKLFTLLHLF